MWEWLHIKRRNLLLSPSPSKSNSSIIALSSSSLTVSPNSLKVITNINDLVSYFYRAIRRSFFKEILPVSSSSNSLKAFRISSRELRWSIISAAELRKIVLLVWWLNDTYQLHENHDMLFYSFLVDHNHAWIFEFLFCEYQILMLGVQPSRKKMYWEWKMK